MTKEFPQISTVLDGLFPPGKSGSSEKKKPLRSLTRLSSGESPNSGRTEKQQAAAKAIKALFLWCKMPDVGDQKVYLAGAVAILADFPLGVIEQIGDPRVATQHMRDFPSLFALRKACEELNEPLERERARLLRWGNSYALLDLRVISEEERRRRCEHVERVFDQLKIDRRRLVHNKLLPKPLSPQERMRLEAELEAMKPAPREPMQ